MNTYAAPFLRRNELRPLRMAGIALATLCCLPHAAIIASATSWGAAMNKGERWKTPTSARGDMVLGAAAVGLTYGLVDAVLERGGVTIGIGPIHLAGVDNLAGPPFILNPAWSPDNLDLPLAESLAAEVIVGAAGGVVASAAIAPGQSGRATSLSARAYIPAA